MPAELIVLPYLLGREGVGMGAGPLALQPGAVEALTPSRVTRLGLSEPFGNEVGACFDLNRQLAREVAGARDFDEGEHARLVGSDVIVLGPHQVAGIEERLGDVERVTLHVDLDVLDPSQGTANRYAVGPGMTRDELLAAVRMIAEDKPLAAVTLSAYDPAYDADGRVADVARAILDVVAR